VPLPARFQLDRLTICVRFAGLAPDVPCVHCMLSLYHVSAAIPISHPLILPNYHSAQPTSSNITHVWINGASMLLPTDAGGAGLGKGADEMEGEYRPRPVELRMIIGGGPSIAR
jgi:hypothetical protein